MSGACFFSKLNASSGYWQTKVNEEISNVLALGTSLGRYRFKRLPYRIHSTCNVFQWEITSIISDVCGSANSLYGIIVWGRTLAEHNECLNKTFLKICKSGPKLNNKKCQIGVKTIVFLRHIISSEGVQVNPAKTEPISKMSFPNSVNELQWFIGLVIYLRKFLSNCAEVIFANLLKKEIKSKLEKHQPDTIEKLKLLVTTTACLKIFNPNLQTTLKLDAISEGLGAILEQDHGTLAYPKWYLVAFASGSLRDNEKCYDQNREGKPFYYFSCWEIPWTSL